jgi:hypothetical protein
MNTSYLNYESGAQPGPVQLEMWGAFHATSKVRPHTKSGPFRRFAWMESHRIWRGIWTARHPRVFVVNDTFKRALGKVC